MNKKIAGSLILAVLIIGITLLGSRLLEAQSPGQASFNNGTNSEAVNQSHDSSSDLNASGALTSEPQADSSYDSNEDIINHQEKTAIADEKEKTSKLAVSAWIPAMSANKPNPDPKPQSSAVTSRATTSRVSDKYNLLSPDKGIYGQFSYRNTGGGRIEIDPRWVSENIVTITLPGLNKRVQVNRAARDKFIKAFELIKNGSVVIDGKQVPLLNLIKSMDGTFVPRHVNWKNANGLSNHSWGTAIDINASDHFRHVDPAQEPYDPNLILWEKAFKPAGFIWGNSYSDAMHFELKG